MIQGWAEVTLVVRGLCGRMGWPLPVLAAILPPGRSPLWSILASGASKLLRFWGFAGATRLASRSRHWGETVASTWGQNCGVRSLGQGEVKGERVADTDPQSSQRQEDWWLLGQVTGVQGSVGDPRAMGGSFVSGALWPLCASVSLAQTGRASASAALGCWGPSPHCGPGPGLLCWAQEAPGSWVLDPGGTGRVVRWTRPAALVCWGSGARCWPEQNPRFPVCSPSPSCRLCTLVPAPGALPPTSACWVRPRFPLPFSKGKGLSGLG